MGTVHQLILTQGLEETRSQAVTKAERQAVQAAAQIMAEEESRLGITHAGFAMTGLPHKRVEDAFWRRQGHMTKLLIESGRNFDGSLVGIPYGSMSRMILLFLQTEAVRTGSPEVELGVSMRSWMTRMSMADGGRTALLHKPEWEFSERR